MNPSDTPLVEGAAACGGAPATLSHTERLQGLGVLAGRMAHDFNNLLVGILGHADLALAELPEGSAARDYVEQIARTALRAAGLTRNILAYAGPTDSSAVWTSGEAVDLNEVIRETCRFVEASLPADIEVCVEAAQYLPAVRGDVTEISQLIMNLVVNAAQAMSGISGRVVLRTGREESGHQLLGPGESTPETGVVFCEVVDEGCGIPTELRELIFEPFFTTRPGGHGLGLAMVKDIALRHGGKVVVESRLGEGSVFRVLLPAWDEAPALSSPPSAQWVDWRPDGPVLVIDDEAQVRDMVTRLMRRAGIEAISVGDMTEALEQLAARPSVSAALLDLHMPGTSGLEAVRVLREAYPSVPVVLTSGSGGAEIDQFVDADGVEGFLPKPYRIEELVTALRQAVERRRLPHTA